MNWRKREDHGRDFGDGDTYLVAVAIMDHRYSPAKVVWELAVITIKCDEDYFAIENSDGDPWGWDWDDVVYYVPIKEVKEGLPQPPKELDNGCTGVMMDNGAIVDDLPLIPKLVRIHEQAEPGNGD